MFQNSVLRFTVNSKSNSQSKHFRYCLVLPFGLPSFDLAHFKFWVITFCVLFYIFVLLDLFVFWWLKVLPNENLKKLQQKGRFFVFLYLLRTLGLKRIVEIFSDTVYNVFWAILTIFVVAVGVYPDKMSVLLTRFYKYLTGEFVSFFTSFYLPIVKKFIKFFYFFYNKWLVFIRPYFAVLFAKYGVVFELPQLIYNSSISLECRLLFYLLPVFIKIACFLLSVTLVWFFIYKVLFSSITFKVAKRFNVTFPRLVLSKSLQKVKSASEFKHTKQLISPVYVQTRTLVGTHLVNFWNSNKVIKIAVNNKRKTRYPVALPFRNRSILLTNFYTPKTYFRDRDQGYFSKIIDRVFNIKHNNIRSFRLHKIDFARQLVVPKIINSRLHYSTILAKNMFVSKRFSSLLSHLPLIISFLKEFDSLFVNINNIQSNCSGRLQLIKASTFSKQKFFKYNGFYQDLFLSKLKLNAVKKFDQRFITNKSLFNYKRFLKPKTLIQSNTKLQISELLELVQLFRLNSFFLKKNKTHSSTLEKSFAKTLKVIKSRRILSRFSIKLKLLVKK